MEQNSAVHSSDPSPKKVGSIFLVFGAIGLLCAIVALVDSCSMRAVFTATLWAFACFAAGTLLGFLFGIPKVANGFVESPVPKAPDEITTVMQPIPALANNNRYRSDPNTNLIEISDWLTKIIVGLGLINLTKIPGHVHALASILAIDLSGTASSTPYLSYSIALIIGFAILGFLFGYLSTRLYLSLAFNKADQAASVQLHRTQQTADAASGAVQSLQDQVKTLTQRVDDRLHGNDQVPLSNSQANEEVQEEGSERVEDTTSKTQPFDKILELAREYVTFHSAGYQERFQAKDQLARSMAIIINDNDGMRDQVVDQNAQEQNEGLIAGFSDAVNSKPQSGDYGKLVKMAKGTVQDRHTIYRIATALGRLFEEGLATREDSSTAFKILGKFKPMAQGDMHLTERLSRTFAQIRNAKGFTGGDPE